MDKQMILLLSVMISLFITTTYINFTVEAEENNDLVRLHIIANSDSPYDQSIKMKVKEKVETIINEITKKEESVESLLNTLENKETQQKLMNAAQEICKDNYDVQIQITNEQYPLKEYEGKIIKQASYNSIKIILGEGNGHNWWQALYPELALVEESYEIIENEENDKNNKEDSDEVKYVISFKIIEFLKQEFFK